MATINENPVQNLIISKNQTVADAKSSKSLKKSPQESDGAKQLTETDKATTEEQGKAAYREDTVTIQSLHKGSMGERSDLNAQDMAAAHKWVEEIKGMIKAESDESRFELVHDLKHENVAGLLA